MNRENTNEQLKDYLNMFNIEQIEDLVSELVDYKIYDEDPLDKDDLIDFYILDRRVRCGPTN